MTYENRDFYPAYLQLAVQIAEQNKIPLSDAEPIARAMANLRDVTLSIELDDVTGEQRVIATKIFPLDTVKKRGKST